MSGELTSRLADPSYVRFQYADDERLGIRLETHERYSENRVPFRAWVLRHVDVQIGQRLLDVGSGPGGYHDGIGHARVVAVDLSAGMLSKVSVPAVQADAQALPFEDDSFDRVMANHGLREMRRVLRDGGRVVIATNSNTTMRPLWALTDEVAALVDVPTYRTVALRFALEDLALVQRVFPGARVEVYEDAFLFRSADPVLAYVASMWVDLGTPTQRSEFLRLLDERVGDIIRREGVFRVPKRAGCFVADV